MNNHNQITQDPNKYGGQAYIIDTDILVNQVVQEALKGTSYKEIETMFNLTDEIILQAMAYAIEDMLHAFSIWKHDSAAPITGIIGYSQILSGKLEMLERMPSEQKQKWAKSITFEAKRAADYWAHLNNWLRINYAIEKRPELTDMKLSELLPEPQFPKNAPQTEAIISKIEENPSFHVLDVMPQALSILIVEPLAPPFVEVENYQPECKIQVDKKTAHFSISRQFALKADGSRFHKKIEDLFKPSTSLAIAALILQQSGTELRVQESEDRITFIFSLTIKQNPDS
ncbi:hypothetical protein MASR2M15_02240 [Anaerolineales bacterium]